MKFLRRLVWYFASRLMLVSLILGLMVVVFYYAMNTTNIYVILKDGMAKRAQIIMMDESPSELGKFFQTGFLDNDSALIATTQGGSPYKDYNVRGIDHRLEMGFLWVWPWDETVKVDIVERIPRIDGRAKGNKAEELVAAGGASALYPPKWQSARYRVTLTRNNGQWRIQSIGLLEALSE